MVREQLNATQRQLWTDFLKKQAMAGLPQLVLQAHGDQLYGVPAMMPVTRKLKVFRPGIYWERLRRNGLNQVTR
ncbi:tRNA and rRNA cytosine-C5-methylase [Lactiplantibacillus plantarum]|uniref:tRNA and rRNA cytosine-C5-methylase n=1 Tax=Lactiplantibacillus plantarum TaxID=1590 RepID=A0AAW3RIK5_LACPN|nr:tRNA and rRNA cytosine-C5-methylase [Lactiplantibacillus plantarum]